MNSQGRSAKDLNANTFFYGKRKPININILGGTVSRDKQEPPLGQTGPLAGTKWDPSLGQTGGFLFNSTVKSPFCPVCPWDGWGIVLGRLSRKGLESEKCSCVFSAVCWFFFFAPNFLKRFGHRRDITANRGISCPKNTSNFLAPTPLRGRPPPRRGISGPESLGLGSFFFPGGVSLIRAVHEYCWLCRLVFGMAQEKRPIGFPNRSPNRTRRRPKAVPEYCWLSRLVSRKAWN